MPEYDARALWEKMVLDGFQAGLAWITILRKREGLRDAFDEFDPEAVAAYGEADIDRLLGDARIIRSRAKINAAIRGAQIWLQMRDDGEDFSAWLWSFVGGEPIQTPYADYRQAPTQTEQSVAMAGRRRELANHLMQSALAVRPVSVEYVSRSQSVHAVAPLPS